MANKYDGLTHEELLVVCDAAGEDAVETQLMERRAISLTLPIICTTYRLDDGSVVITAQVATPRTIRSYQPPADDENGRRGYVNLASY